MYKGIRQRKTSKLAQTRCQNLSVSKTNHVKISPCQKPIVCNKLAVFLHVTKLNNLSLTRKFKAPPPLCEVSVISIISSGAQYVCVRGRV
jgi:hypothetical protein